MAPVVKRLYDHLAEPKWVVAMGGVRLQWRHVQHVTTMRSFRGVDKIVPVDRLHSRLPSPA